MLSKKPGRDAIGIFLRSGNQRVHEMDHSSETFARRLSASLPIGVAALAVLTIVPTCFADNVALGRPYRFSHPPNYPYCTDTGDTTDLTDGVRYDPRGTSLWTQKGTVGWAIGDQLKSIEIDLGQICSINGVSFETAADNRSQGTFPLAVLVFLSDDGKSYNYAGDVISESVNQSTYVVHTFRLSKLKEQARFVRLVTVRGGFYVFVDEIEVLGSKTRGLTPRKRDHDSEAVLKVAQQRVPLTRQNNSSLTLLAHAKARLAVQSGQDQEPIRHARAMLARLRSRILTRTEAEEVNFRRGVPFTKVDREICGVIGRYLAATSKSKLMVRTANPWAPLMPFDWKPSADPGQLTLMKNEWGELALNVTNATAAPMELTVTTDGPPPGAVSVFEVKFVEAFGFRIRADALMPLRGKLRIPPGMTQQVWLRIDTRALRHGHYKGLLELTGESTSDIQPFSFTVANVEMPRPKLHVVNFSYMHWPIAKTDPRGVERDLREHYVDTQVVVSSYLPNPVANASGNITQPMDFSQLDKYMDLLPDTRLWIFFMGFEWDHRKMYPIPADARRETLFKQWLSAMIAHVKQRGLGYENFAFLWHDEPSQEAMRKIVTPSTQVLRSVDPKARVWIDISSDNTAESIEQFDGAADIWCPTSDKIKWGFWKDKRTWFYDSASDKGRSPSGHYRYKLWLGVKHGATGNGFWTYTDSSNLWDDYAGSPTYSVVYDGPDGVISSKRWEAYRAGVEDYELCRILRQTITARAEHEGQTRTVIDAWTSLDQWVKRVLKNRHDPTTADRAHNTLLKLLVRLSSDRKRP